MLNIQLNIQCDVKKLIPFILAVSAIIKYLPMA